MFNATKLAAMALAGTQAVDISSQTQTSLSATVNEGALAQITFDRDALNQEYGNEAFEQALDACEHLPKGELR